MAHVPDAIDDDASLTDADRAEIRTMLDEHMNDGDAEDFERGDTLDAVEFAEFLCKLRKELRNDDDS